MRDIVAQSLVQILTTTKAPHEVEPFLAGFMYSVRFGSAQERSDFLVRVRRMLAEKTAVQGKLPAA